MSIRKINFVAEQDNSNKKISVGEMKKLTGNDSLIRKPYNENEYSFKPLFKMIIPENDGFSRLENLKPKSKKSYEIKNKQSVFGNMEMVDEYIMVSNLFENANNILNFSDSKYLVIWSQDEKNFYVKEISTGKIFKCAYDDILHIHYTVYGPTRSYTPIQSLEISKGNIKYNFEEKYFIGKKLDLDIFKVFIASDFDSTMTINVLRSSINNDSNNGFNKN